MARVKIPLTDKDLKQVKVMAGMGFTVERIALILGMSKKTLERRIKDTDGAKDALEKGRAVGALSVTITAYGLATSGKCPAMTMFWLKCRERWKEVQGVSLEDPDGEPVFTSVVDLITAAARSNEGKPKKPRSRS